MPCMEVWGGSQLTARGVVFGGLDAWVYSKPHGKAQRGGDVYYASSCAAGRISRLLLADVKPEKLIDALLGEIAERYPENLSNDDVTLLIVRANGAAQSFTLGDKMRAAARMAGGAIRSLYPGRRELPSN
jgi:hypothetical protein